MKDSASRLMQTLIEESISSVDLWCLHIHAHTYMCVRTHTHTLIHTTPTQTSAHTQLVNISIYTEKLMHANIKITT